MKQYFSTIFGAHAFKFTAVLAAGINKRTIYRRGAIQSKM
jgi:hypothetical protein